MQARKVLIMYAEYYADLLGFLMRSTSAQRNMVFVEDMHRGAGERHSESDAAKPNEAHCDCVGGLQTCLPEAVSDDAITRRNMAEYPNQLKEHLSDIATDLTQTRKRLAYLFLFEYGSGLREWELTKCA